MSWLRFSMVAITVAIGLSACTNFTSPARVRELGSSKSYWFDYDASRRGTILAHKNAHGPAVITCAEPAPDVALAFTSKVLGQAKVTPAAGTATAIDAKAEAEFRSSVIDLAKRTQTIMFVREAMYRLCEQSLNGQLAPNAVESLYRLIVDTSVRLAEAEVTREQARLAEAVKDPETRKFIDELLKGSP